MSLKEILSPHGCHVCELVDETLILPINRLVRKYPADATSRIRHVASVPRYKVNVQVWNCLACSNAVIDADIKTIGRELFEQL